MSYRTSPYAARAARLGVWVPVRHDGRRHPEAEGPPPGCRRGFGGVESRLTQPSFI